MRISSVLRKQRSAHCKFASIVAKFVAKFSVSALACQRSFVPTRPDRNPQQSVRSNPGADVDTHEVAEPGPAADLVGGEHSPSADVGT